MGRRAEGPRPAGGWLWLAAAILSSCFLLTQAQEIPVIAEPSQLSEGGEVTLTPQGEANFLTCIWYREEEKEEWRILTYDPVKPEQRYGPVATWRETSGPGCILHIEPLFWNDTGNYVMKKTVASDKFERGNVYIDVKEGGKDVVRIHGSGTSVVKKGVTSVMLFGAWAGVVLLGVLL